MMYTLNLSDRFDNQIADYILSHVKSPIQVAQTRLILPTKRACRSVKEAFVRKSANQPLLLPQLTALYEIEDISEQIPEAISPIERLFLLARLCRAKPNIDTLDKALKIAASLAEILDEFYLFEISPDCLENLIPQRDLAIHWNESITFLDIIRTAWPKILAERGKIDAADRRIRRINQLTNQVLSNQVNYPIILAGFDGSIPAVKRLIDALSNRNNALILFNGLNEKITKEEWKHIQPNHYQYAFKNIIKTLGEVRPIPALSIAEVPHEALIHEALKPAEQTHEWREATFNVDTLKNVHQIECDNLNEEALTIATIMRSVLETPEKTAALVTNDRNLARRVISEMRRWGIDLDDSAGTPLHHTPLGVYLSLLADYGVNQADGHALLALLKHPFAADKKRPTDLRADIRAAEKKARKDNKKLSYEFQTDISPFLTCFAQEEALSFHDLLNAHLTAAELLATSQDRTGIERLWGSDAGETAYRFFNELQEYAPLLGDVKPAQYPDILKFLMQTQSIRPKYGMHPRLDILGPIEARMSHPDVCIIGGLNDGIFPTIPDTGPWLGRSMRTAAGLPIPEAEIGTQSMDFAHCFCAPEVYLTRSLKIDGSQTIPSRFLSRIEAVLKGAGIEQKIEKPILARLIDAPTRMEKIQMPTPRPPKHLRPQQLSVTNIERLKRNPYGVYARYILKLYPLNELEKFSETNMYGTALHKAFESMIKNNNFNFDSNLLFEEIKAQLKELNMSDSALMLYLPRLKKAAEFVMAEQRQRHNRIKATYCETEGAVQVHLWDGTPFTITAEADRIDIFNDGSAEIIDYKTGSTPSFKEIAAGYAPQLPLEGLIAQKGGFKDIKTPLTDISLSFWQVSGKETGGSVKPVITNDKNGTYADLIQKSQKVIDLLNAYQNDTTPYEAHPKPKYVRYDDYEHLARVKEWITENDEGESA